MAAQGNSKIRDSISNSPETSQNSAFAEHRIWQNPAPSCQQHVPTPAPCSQDPADMTATIVHCVWYLHHPALALHLPHPYAKPDDSCCIHSVYTACSLHRLHRTIHNNPVLYGVHHLPNTDRQPMPPPILRLHLTPKRIYVHLSSQ